MRARARVLMIAAAVAAAPAPAGARPGDSGAPTATGEVERCDPEGRRSPEGHIQRAAEHYDRGLVLYEQGDYEGAIAEFVAGYCDAPNPIMFYNIAQSYERLLDYDKAVAYFERFLRESAGESTERNKAALRVKVLEQLPARIRVATVPPGATVTLTDDTGVRARAEANASEPILAEEGTYTMHIEMPGYRPIEQTVDAEIGQPYSFYVRLEPKKGTIRITASPSDARIFLDQRLVGIGSYVETIPVGSHAVTVEAEGREAVTREIEVGAQRAHDVAVELEKPPDSGRRSLVIGSTVAGLVYGGATAASVFGGDVAPALLGSAAGLGVGFGGAYLGVPDDITVGQANYVISSALIGAAEGGLVTSYFACDTREGEDGTRIETCDDGVIAGAALASGVVGAGVGALTSGKLDLSAGDAALVNSGAIWGATSGALFYSIFDTDSRIREPLLLAGLNLGIVTSAVLAGRAEPSRGRVALIDLAGLGGIIAGAAAGEALQGTGGDSIDQAALLGMATGLATGTFLTRNMDVRDASGLTPAVGTATDAAGDSAVTLGVGGAY